MYPPKKHIYYLSKSNSLIIACFSSSVIPLARTKAATNSGNQQYYFKADIHIPYSCFSYMFYKKQQHHVTAYLIHLHCPHLCFSNH